MQSQITAMVSQVMAAPNVAAIEEVIADVAQQIAAERLIPDLKSLSDLRRAVDRRWPEIAPKDADRQHPKVGQAKSAVMAQIHQLGVLANRLHLP